MGKRNELEPIVRATSQNGVLANEVASERDITEIMRSYSEDSAQANSYQPSMEAKLMEYANADF